MNRKRYKQLSWHNGKKVERIVYLTEKQIDIFKNNMKPVDPKYGNQWYEAYPERWYEFLWVSRPFNNLKAWIKRTSFGPVRSYLGKVSVVFIGGLLATSVFYYFVTRPSSEEPLPVVDDRSIETRIGTIMLREGLKYVMFYGTPTPTDTVHFHSTIPISIMSRSNDLIDSIEVGFLLPTDAGLHVENHEYEDNPNLVDRYFNINWRTATSKYVVRRLNKGFVYHIEEPVYLPVSNAQIHLQDGQTYSDVIGQSKKKAEVHNLQDVEKENGVVQMSWDFQIYSTGPRIETNTYRMGICRKKVRNREELRLLAQDYLRGLDEKEQKTTSALILFNRHEYLMDTTSIVNGDTISVPVIRDLIELEEITELFLEPEKEIFIERTQLVNDVDKTYPVN